MSAEISNCSPGCPLTEEEHYGITFSESDEESEEEYIPENPHDEDYNEQTLDKLGWDQKYRSWRKYYIKPAHQQHVVTDLQFAVTRVKMEFDYYMLIGRRFVSLKRDFPEYNGLFNFNLSDQKIEENIIAPDWQLKKTLDIIAQEFHLSTKTVENALQFPTFLLEIALRLPYVMEEDNKKLVRDQAVEDGVPDATLMIRAPEKSSDSNKKKRRQ